MSTSTPRTIRRPFDNFDRTATFNIVVGRWIRGGEKIVKASIICEDGAGGFHVMQHPGVLASSYTQDEVAERERLAAEEPFRHNDVVMVDDKPYRLLVNGDYSDCAILAPVTF